MRRLILIAGFALVSVAAHAGDRSLSLGGGETTKVSAPAKAIEGSRTAEVPQAAEAPKYVERPAVVDPKSEATKAGATRPGTMRSETDRSRPAAGSGQRMRHRPTGMQQRYAGRPPSVGAGGPSARRTAMLQRGAGAHRVRFGIKARIISALHRHGIYW
jgi:hypothetical protein